jgi:anti-anti-sigma regulatory factor
LTAGTAERLARQVDAAVQGDVLFVVLDLRRVNELDSTGAAIVLQAAARLRAEGVELLLAHLGENTPAVAALREAGVARISAPVFPDTDAALEWAEDALNALVKEHPRLAVQLLANLARELSIRLRHATRIITELER